MLLSAYTIQVLLPLLLLGTSVQAVEFTVKEDRICKFRKGKSLETNTLREIKLRNGLTDYVPLAEAKCVETDGCLGFELYGRKCTLIKNKVVGFQKSQKNSQTNNSSKIYTCGMLAETPAPTLSPSVSTSPTELHDKVFEFDENSRCKVTKGETRKSSVFQKFSRAQCDHKCGNKKKCKSYSWNSNKEECTLFKYRVKATRKNKVGSVCARLPKGTKAPQPPTPAPSPRPTEKVKCNIKATLKFPFDKVNEAPYYGGHADWLEVTKKNHRNKYVCSSYYASKKDLPAWCEYKNSDKDGDSAYVENLEDYYYTQSYLNQYQKLTSETIKIKDAADHITIIEGYHWLFAEDYYPNDPDWQDHMMVPELIINNMSNDAEDQIGRKLKHPVSKNIPTHKKKNGKWVGNPAYKGNISVEIHCNKFCRCEQKHFKASTGFEDMRLLPGEVAHHPPRHLFPENED